MSTTLIAAFLAIFTADDLLTKHKIAIYPLPESEILTHTYLGRLGDKFNCYFTIEQAPLHARNWISHSYVTWNPRLASFDDIVEDISRQVKGVYVYRSKENPSVIHIMHTRLKGNKEYVLNQKATLNYNGKLQDVPEGGLIGELHKMHPTQLKTKTGFLTGGWPGLRLDTITEIGFVAKDVEIRRILTDCLSLSGYSRILWIAETEQRHGMLETKFQYLGPRE